MTDTLSDLERARCHRLNEDTSPDAPSYVLVWLQQTLRAHDNPAIEIALNFANERQLPLVVYHGLRMDYPYASVRLHRFILEASMSMARDLAARSIRCVRYVERPDAYEKGLVYRLADKAAHVFVDEHYTYITQTQARRFAAKTNCPVTAIDASRLVPTRSLESGLKTTKDFRAAHRPVRQTYLAPVPARIPSVPRYDGPLCFTQEPDTPATESTLKKLLASLPIDQSLPPGDFSGDRDSAERQLAWAVDAVVPRYRYERNNPANDASTCKLSPYMHFGVLSPNEVVRAIGDADIPASTQWKFLDELLTWREWSHYRAHWMPNITQFSALPVKVQQTLNAHADDARPEEQTLKHLLYGQTPDALWNAAQRQWLRTGWMHNNLRMYWSKRLIAFTPSPQHGWALACYLNDRLSYDGRDPATYASMRWAFGEGKPAYRDQPIYGTVAPKSSRTLLTRDGVPDWIETQLSKACPDADVPTWDQVLARYT